MRKLVKDTFGVEFDALTYEIIESYFSEPREESIYFEFKGYSGSWDQDLNEVQKAIVALLNSEGGIIVWGSPFTENHGEKRKEDRTRIELQPITKKVDNVNISQQLSGQIEPYPSGIEVRTLFKEGKSIVIISVERTRSTPYMLRERGYYYRVGKNSKIAPHHYVEALMKQVSFPDIRCQLLKDTGPEKIEEDRNSRVFRIEMMAVFKNYSLFENEHNFACIYKTLEKGVRETQPYRKIFDLFSASDQMFFPVEVNVRISIDQNDLAGKFHLILRWGGQKSPGRCSKYLISLRLSDILIEPVYEDKFFYEISPDDWDDLPDIVVSR